jgi:hypothetical protein
MKKLFVVLFVVAALCSYNIYAQGFAKKGCIETGGTIAFSSQTDVVNDETADESLTSFALEPYIGYFVIEGLELGLMPIFTSESIGDNSTSMFGIFFAPSYNFNTQSQVYPFIEGRVGYNTFSQDNGVSDQSLSGISFGGRGGIKVSLGGSSLLNIGIEYMMYTFDPEDPPAGFDGRYGANVLAVSAGWTVFFN